MSEEAGERSFVFVCLKMVLSPARFLRVHAMDVHEFIRSPPFMAVLRVALASGADAATCAEAGGAVDAALARCSRRGADFASQRAMFEKSAAVCRAAVRRVFAAASAEAAQAGALDAEREMIGALRGEGRGFELALSAVLLACEDCCRQGLGAALAAPNEPAEPPASI